MSVLLRPFSHPVASSPFQFFNFPSLPSKVSISRSRPLCRFTGRIRENVHSGELGSGSASDLLHAKLTELGLQLIELLHEIILAFAPELAGLNLSGRLEFMISAFVPQISRFNRYVPWWSASFDVVKWSTWELKVGVVSFVVGLGFFFCLGVRVE